MRILLVHQNFPGQYKYLGPALAERGHQVVALCINPPPPVAGVTVLRYAPSRGSARDVHPWATEFETKVIRGEAAFRAGQALKAKGFTPDLICAHPGWGEALFLKDVFPEARLLIYHEFHYKAVGQDMGFDPEFPVSGPEEFARLRAKNAHSLLSLDASDAALSPTNWQASTAPDFFRDRVRVIHDGVNTDRLRPDPAAALTLPDGRRLTAGDEVITYLARNLEPYRGFHIFARSLPELLRRRPKAQVLVVGENGVSYGRRPPDGQSYRDRYMAEVADRIDASRVHFLGKLPYDQFVSLVQVSSAHIYLTYPFVLSWSMLEAMAAGALVIGSATPPVQEVIQDGVNGRLVDFFDPEGLAATVADSLERRAEMQPLRAAARQTICDRYDLHRICLPRQIALVEALGQGRPLPATA